MFKPIWVYYVIIIRAITLQLTLFELKAFIKTKGIKRINLNYPKYIYKSYPSFECSIKKNNPLVSIIIPTLNRYDQLSDVLRDLESQDYKNTEIIIIDQSEPIKKEFYNYYQLNMIFVKQEDKALWKARNSAILMSKGDFILLLDDDSRIDKYWVSEHLKCLAYFNADISAGVSMSAIGAPIPKHYSYFRWADQLDTGNVLLKRQVFEKCGLFDLQFEGMRMGDGEFGARAYKNGLRIINNSNAKRIHLKTSYGGLREISGWDSFRPINVLAPRPIPSVLYFYRKYWDNKASILSLLITIPISLMSYKLKGKKVGNYISIMFFLILFPLVFIQILRSWLFSSKMLKDGAKVNNLIQ